MKAILVIEMPHCCHDCICADWDMCLCKAKNEEIYSQSYMDGGRQPWCPLKPMPNKAAETLLKGLDAMEKMKSVEVRVIRRTE